MVLSFANKLVFVTGGANGIGRAIVELMQAAGADVRVFDVEADNSQGTCKVDVTDGETLERVFREAGVPDVVIANAGTVRLAPIEETSAETWQRVIDVNLTGVFHTVRAAARLMKPARKGSIVLTASTNSWDGEATLVAYNATKAGVLGILHTAANELGPFGVRVNAVCPGLIRTRLTSDYFSDPVVLKSYFRHIPLGRGGEPREVAHAAAFLASDLASYVTGTTLIVDGGQLCSKYSTWDEATARFEGDRWRLNE